MGRREPPFVTSLAFERRRSTPLQSISSATQRAVCDRIDWPFIELQEASTHAEPKRADVERLRPH